MFLQAAVFDHFFKHSYHYVVLNVKVYGMVIADLGDPPPRLRKLHAIYEKDISYNNDTKCIINYYRNSSSREIVYDRDEES